MILTKNIIYKLYDKNHNKVQVNYIIYNKKSKNIIKFGSSRPNGKNTYYDSVHAEIIALRNFSYKSKHIIIIFKLDNDYNILPAYSCLTCTKHLKKKKISHIFYTIKNNKLISSIIENPVVCFGIFLKYHTK